MKPVFQSRCKIRKEANKIHTICEYTMLIVSDMKSKIGKWLQLKSKWRIYSDSRVKKSLFEEMCLSRDLNEVREWAIIHGRRVKREYIGECSRSAWGRKEQQGRETRRWGGYGDVFRDVVRSYWRLTGHAEIFNVAWSVTGSHWRGWAARGLT